MLQQNNPAATEVSIGGEEYRLVPGKPVAVVPVRTQPGEMSEEFERRIFNAARGWGETQYAGPGGYNYGSTACLHVPGLWKNGITRTTLTLGATPVVGSPVHFSEYWDGTAANRRLVITTRRHIFEVEPDGTVNTADLGASFTLARGMSKAVRYKNSALASPVMFVARPSSTTTDYMVERTGDGTYAVSANNKYAGCIAVGKDPDGEDILWRVTSDGKLNASLADTDPTASANWASATYPVGETSVKVMDMMQQAGVMLVTRQDGVWSFDNVLNSIPITPAIGGALEDYNGQWMTDFNGIALAPTFHGLIWVDGLEWGAAGPVSANPEARSIRYQEVCASAIAGNWIYAATYDGSNSYLYVGQPRETRPDGTGRGPIVWHGPIGIFTYRISAIFPSGVWGKKLWVGAFDPNAVGNSYVQYASLNDDWSPVSLGSGSDYIYLPEGILDIDGPGIIKDFRKAEFIAPPSFPFSDTNRWTIEVETTPGSGTYVGIGSYTPSSGNVGDLYWTTETSGKHLRARLSHQPSAGSGEGQLEMVIVRGTQRPETTREYTFTIDAEDNPRKRRGARLFKSGFGQVDALEALEDSGRTAVISWGEESFTGKVVRVQRVTAKSGEVAMPRHTVEVTIRKVKLA